MIKQSPHLAAPISQALMDKAAAAIHKIAYDPEHADNYAEDILQVIEGLNDEVLDFFFITPLRQMRVGGVTLKAAQVGIASAKKGMKLVTKRIIKAMPPDHLVGVSEFLEAILFEAMEENAAARQQK